MGAAAAFRSGHRPFNLAPLPSLRKLLKIGPGVSVAAKSAGRQAAVAGAVPTRVAPAEGTVEAAEWCDMHSIARYSAAFPAVLIRRRTPHRSPATVHACVLPKLTWGGAAGTNSEPLPKIELTLYLAEADTHDA